MGCVHAIERRENVTVLGDYDVDGVSSTTLLVGLVVYTAAFIGEIVRGQQDVHYA